MDTLGVVESRSIAAGVELADGMVKTADVELVRASAICSGRYMIHVAGDREAVETAVRSARESGRSLAGSFVISNISPLVIAALKRNVTADSRGAIGVIESRTASSGVAAADSAVKRADVRLVRLITGQGINGKSYFVVCGDVAAVREAAEAARKTLGDRLVEAVVIPSPDASVVAALTGA